MTEPTNTSRSARRSATLATALGASVLALAVGFAGGRATLAASATTPPEPVRLHATDIAPAGIMTSYSQIVDEVAPAVVTVRVDKHATMPASLPEPFRDFFGPQFPGGPEGRMESGLGSGVVIRPDGYILTNHHVIADAERIRVDLSDGRSWPAKLVGSDTGSDLAVLQVDASDLPTVAFGDSDRTRVGDLVLAFGNPLGVGQTVTMGIVSAKGRAPGVADDSYEDFLQTDAPINQGNSGGALVNMQGELIGINAQILSPSGGNIGLGFAIPSSMAHAVADELIRDGVVHRSKLGVTVQPVTPDLARSLGTPGARGALVADVEPGSPADRAGLRQGDVIAAFDGHPVADSNALRNQVAGTRPGTSVDLTVLRAGRTEHVSARLVERENPGEPASGPAGDEGHGESSLGMTLRPLTPQLAERLELPKTDTGLVVTAIDPAGAAASAGIQPGDVITRVNDRNVESVAALRDALEARRDRPALLLLNRRGADLFVALPQSQS